MNIFIYGKYILPSFPHVRLVHNPLSRLPALPLHKIVMSALGDGGLDIHLNQIGRCLRGIFSSWSSSGTFWPLSSELSEHWDQCWDLLNERDQSRPLVNPLFKAKWPLWYAGYICPQGYFFLLPTYEVGHISHEKRQIFISSLIDS